MNGYIKTNFYPAFNNKLNKFIGYGSITDGSFKLEIHIMNFSDEDIVELDLKKGDKIEITGIMQTNGKNIYIYN